MAAWAVKLEVSRLNVTCHDRLDSTASDQIARCRDGGRQGPRILMVGKVTEARAEGIVALDKWDAYPVNFATGHCHARNRQDQKNPGTAPPGPGDRAD